MSYEYPFDLKALVDESLLAYFPQIDTRLDPLVQAMRYSLFSSSKRFRPVLTLMAARAVGGTVQSALPFACAVEFIHTYSLIHDDLPAIDDDTVRRGRPTCHVKFGEDIAILAGDALCAEAFVLILREQAKTTDPQILVRVLKELAAAIGVNGMVGGQVLDMISTGRDVDQTTLSFIHHHKTGSLITASARCGAIIGGGSAEQVEAVTKYASDLGLAFQIIDDILDVEGTTESVGKNVGSDEDNRKTTFPSKLGVKESQKRANASADQAIQALSDIELDKEGLVELANFVVRRTA